MFRRIVATLPALALAVALPTLAAAPPKPRVVVLGFDGADSHLVEKWMDEGKLPNLAKLRADGSYAPLMPTNPPQTPVSWSSFATGTNPGKTHIFDFLMRSPSNYLPDFAMNSEGRRPFLFGTRNGLVVGLIFGFGLFALVALGLLLVRLRAVTRVAIAVLCGLAAGLPAGFVAATYLPAEVPTAINHRKGETIWDLATKAGLKAMVIRVPATFPAEDVGQGHMISGLGVPDIRGRVGTPTYYTSDPTFEPGANNQFSLELIRLPQARGTMTTRVVGPYNKPFYDYVVDRKTAGIADPRARAEAKRRVRQELDDADVPRRIDIPMTLEATDDALTIKVSGQTQTLKVGEWSTWFTFEYPINWLVDAASPFLGIGRFKLLQLKPQLELYLSPVNFHPDCHPVAFAWPPSYSTTIRKRFGLYKTIGWPEDTWSLPSGVGDESLFLQDMYFTIDKDEEIMKGLLGDHNVDVYIQIYYFTDRIGHLFWRFLDPGHPLYDPVKAAKWAPEVLKAYQRMDRIVGEARKIAGPQALFIVLSDHGFTSFRRGVNINTWLVRNGFMKLKGQTDNPATLAKLFDTRDLFQNVDWSRTKAYALGLGSIYINLVGREKDGIVLPGPEYQKVCQQIKTGLEALVDPLTGKHPVEKVWTRDEMYTGYDPDLIPDLRAGNALNYRVSWQTSLGGVPKDLIEDNLSAWSGDHCSNAPSLVKGIFFVNHTLNRSDPAMVDVAPTIMKALHLKIPSEVDGTPLF